MFLPKINVKRRSWTPSAHEWVFRKKGKEKKKILNLKFGPRKKRVFYVRFCSKAGYSWIIYQK